jgi:hypothetical protein
MIPGGLGRPATDPAAIGGSNCKGGWANSNSLCPATSPPESSGPGSARQADAEHLVCSGGVELAQQSETHRGAVGPEYLVVVVGVIGADET